MTEADGLRRRSYDPQLEKLSKIWPILVGLGGISLAVYTGILKTQHNATEISGIDSRVAGLERRLNLTEQDGAVKNYQFGEIIKRLDKMDTKIDILSERKTH